MDFHSMPRRDLQTLCKKNRIPANMTNVAMADALQTLFAAGEIDCALDALQNESLKKAAASSIRRPSARRAAAPIEPEDKPGSPLPRSRRVSVSASEIRRLVADGEEDDEKKEDLVEMTPVTVVKRTTARKPQGTATRTIRRASKKEDADAADECPIETAKTPATRNGRRTASRKAAETPAAVEPEAEETIVASRMTTRRTRQSSKSTTIDLTTTTVRRSTRTRARAPNPAMETLAPEAEQVKEGFELSLENVSDLEETKGIELDLVEKVEEDAKSAEAVKEAGRSDANHENFCGLVVEVRKNGESAEAIEETDGTQEKITDDNNEKDCGLVVDVEEDGKSSEAEEVDRNDEEIVAEQEVEEAVEVSIPLERDCDADEKPAGCVEEHASQICPTDLQVEIEGETDGDQDFEEDSAEEEQTTKEIQDGVQDDIVCREYCEQNLDGDQDFEEDPAEEEQTTKEIEVGDQDDIVCSEYCEQNFNVVDEYSSVAQSQLALDAKKDGTVQETEELVEQLVAESEGSCGGDEANQAEADTGVTGLEGSPVQGLITYLENKLENLEIGGDAADEESKEEMVEEVGLDLGSHDEVQNQVPVIEGSNNGKEILNEEIESAMNKAEIVAASFAQQICLQGSDSETDRIISELEKNEKSQEVGESQGSPAKISSETDKIISELEKNEKSQEDSDADMENKSSDEKVENDDAQKKENLDLNYHLMSLRKLRTIYKEKIVNINNKVEARRLPLGELNDNITS